ncbi:MAG: helicase C-terminal domain-containing protein [Frankiaceae bacterium]
MSLQPRFVDDLRGRSDGELTEFFTSRADLLVPLPPDINTLAHRSLSRWSISAALAGVDLWCGELAQALVALGSPASYDRVAEALGAEPDAVARGLNRLRQVGLAWGSPQELYVAPPLTEMLAPVLAQPCHPQPPTPDTRRIGVAAVDQAGGDTAATVTRLVEDLLDEWGATAPPVLKTGGLGLRELRRTATVLDVPEPTAALLVETAYAAGLLGNGGGYDAQWLPTPAFDAWQAGSVAQRWVTLASAWLNCTRAPGRALTRDERGKTRTALSSELSEPREPGQRRALLDVLAELPTGSAADATEIAEVVAWYRPLDFDPALAAEALSQAELLGLTGRGAITTAGQSLLAGALAGDQTNAASALVPHLPSPLDHVLLQADLTAVAPGPLDPPLARELRLLADVESTGGATVYRFADASLRRAFDAGRSAGDVHDWLRRASRTPVPQALSYLVDDVARRHGRIRVGSASAYLRCDDEALLGEVLASRRTSSLRLRRLAPTVLAARAPVGEVVDVLRAAGFAPARESPEGAVVIERTDRRRTQVLPRPAQRIGRSQPKAQQITAAVRALRAGERAARHRPPPPGPAGPPVHEPMATLRLMRQAAAEGRSVWIDYLNSAGVASQRIIEPAFLDGGRVIAYDHRRGERRTFAAHRIVGAALLSEDDLFSDAVSEDEE